MELDSSNLISLTQFIFANTTLAADIANRVLGKKQFLLLKHL